MSLIGIGSDLCDIRRIERVLARHGERFLVRVFTDAERRRAERRHGQARLGAYAKRWAAKEACAKALGTGFSHGVFHHDLGVDNLPGGQPVMVLTGGAKTRLHVLTPPGSTARILLSMTDEYPYAFAQVMIETGPLP
ncbi:holo-acyl-carrier-protein synthase [Gluconacetobacter diazotrophicus PA1 5]|uniref:Holo-[acyl-carrier-protein] synthase n=2 Tax=Gluconacetobacter diazotrophicus TaxID=33996 RepID=A9HKX9_GLUDA|nr:holo-ACP synthase [Gluconacetobacter diazotrophicus]ACI50171.1 holo-acyl-carrier-protein synthase [Gluconacetobacter diazotrophicus PA1 5]MBB2154909.1 holo-ACP synthase [Gluconacetobacter diazotrophicus]TWB08073.1 holo-[acyl-carrier protein] synthase [Gluconacetobacter diazotrophicus]CAP56098.1 putative holo-[acyl-carrier-protein] synthase [Gluconacetobacter diazotrophicus PA1 5]